MTSRFTFVAVSVLAGALSGAMAAYAILSWKSHDTSSLIAEFYATENAVHVSPHGLRGKMDKGVSDYILVDLRSAQEYEKEHIVGAVNIPAYSDPDHSAYDEVDRIVTAFRQLPQEKQIIVYCYSTPCMTGRKIGKMLAGHGIYVQHLGIGWNDWRYHWTMWNHEHEWKTTNAEQYVVSGKDPGTPQIRSLPAPCGEGSFGC
jgi:rhodanese-related sulfurtransferase